MDVLRDYAVGDVIGPSGALLAEADVFADLVPGYLLDSIAPELAFDPDRPPLLVLRALARHWSGEDPALVIEDLSTALELTSAADPFYVALYAALLDS